MTKITTMIRHHHPLLLIAIMATAIAIATPSIQGAKFGSPGGGWAARRTASSASLATPSSSIHNNNKNYSHYHHHHHHLLGLRGGAINSTNNDNKEHQQEEEEEEDDEEELHQKRLAEHQKLLKYKMEQQLLYQLRSTYLSEMMASRGLGVAGSSAGSSGGGGGVNVGSIPTLTSVATKEGEKPPEKCDWDCALCTEDDPKSCLYSFDAEPNTKVVSPLGTTQWISLSALNRLRRTDPTKVEPMWHSRYSILHSWFSDASEFSMLQHVGMKGFIVSSVLLDGGNGMALRSLLLLGVAMALVLMMPLLEYIVGRVLVSAPFWGQWTTWGRIARAGFPLKLLLGQLAWKGLASSFGKLESEVREYIVDLECEILEESVPLTVGVELMEEEEEEGEEEWEEEDEVEEGVDVVESDGAFDDDYDDDDDEY